MSHRWTICQNIQQNGGNSSIYIPPWPIAVLLLVQRLRHWTNVKSAVDRHLVPDGDESLITLLSPDSHYSHHQLPWEPPYPDRLIRIIPILSHHTDRPTLIDRWLADIMAADRWLADIMAADLHPRNQRSFWASHFGNLSTWYMKWNESGFRPPLCTYRLNWARRTSWGWWDDWDDTVLQTQDSKFEPWRSEAEHATSRSRRLPTILTFTRGWGRNIFVSFKPPRPGTEPRTLAWKAAVLTTTLGPPPCLLDIGLTIRRHDTHRSTQHRSVYHFSWGPTFNYQGEGGGLE